MSQYGLQNPDGKLQYCLSFYVSSTAQIRHIHVEMGLPASNTPASVDQRDFLHPGQCSHAEEALENCCVSQGGTGESHKKRGRKKGQDHPAKIVPFQNMCAQKGELFNAPQSLGREEKMYNLSGITCSTTGHGRVGVRKNPLFQ